jgi:predicted amidohydrolase
VSRRIVVAATQMNANVALLVERLARAEQLVSAAAQQGAHLVVLPELFNLGYAYNAANYARAETLRGPTIGWLRATAARWQVYLAGTLLLRDGAATFNAMLLVAPDGYLWRYDKQYPWGWERAYFRGGSGGPVADTPLGRIGMLICWDIAHPQVWRRYAGQVDLLLIASCPPDAGNPLYQFPNGHTRTARQLGPLFARLRPLGARVFRTLVSEQALWLGVPVVHAGASGRLTLELPSPRAAAVALSVGAPQLLRQLPQAAQLHMQCGMVDACAIVGADGVELAMRSQPHGEGVAVAQVALAPQPPTPRGPQPPANLPVFAYLTSDYVLPGICKRYCSRRTPIVSKILA